MPRDIGGERGRVVGRVLAIHRDDAARPGRAVVIVEDDRSAVGEECRARPAQRGIQEGTIIAARGRSDAVERVEFGRAAAQHRALALRRRDVGLGVAA